MQATTLEPCRASASPVNPNAGKRRARTLANRAPRTTVRRGEHRSSVTVLHLDPAAMRRARAANGGRLSERALDRADVIARGVKSRSGVRAAAEIVKSL